MKTLKYATIVLVSLLIGAIAGAYAVGHVTTNVSNHDIVADDVDRVLHVLWLVDGKGDDVIDVNMKVIEEGITKTNYHEVYPGTIKQSDLMAKWIETIYTNSSRDMPEHVADWIDLHKL